MSSGNNNATGEELKGNNRNGEERISIVTVINDDREIKGVLLRPTSSIEKGVNVYKLKLMILCQNANNI